MPMIRFRGARIEYEDDGEKKYSDRGPIWINRDAVIGFYEHTLLTANHQIRVMEKIWEIGAKMRVPISRLEFDREFMEKVWQDRMDERKEAKRELDFSAMDHLILTGAEEGSGTETAADAGQGKPETKDGSDPELMEEIRMG